MSEDQITMLILAAIGGLFLLIYGYFIWKFWRERDTINLAPYQRSWLGLLLLNILTLGGYYLYWYLQTSRILNRQAIKPISPYFQLIAVLFMLGNLALAFIVEDDSRSTALGNLSHISDRMLLIVMLIWAFEVRRVIGEKLAKRPNAVMTFFFGCLYLHESMKEWLKLEQK